MIINVMLKFNVLIVLLNIVKSFKGYIVICEGIIYDFWFREVFSNK